MLQDLHSKNISAGMVSALLAISGPPVIILEAAASGGFTVSQTIMWMFAVYVFGGLYSIVIPLYYRIPIVGAHSITGVAFLATVTTQFTYNELIGAYLLSGLLMLLIGYFGTFAKLLSYVPKEIIAAMLAGMITKYMVSFVLAINELAVVGMVTVGAFFIFTKWPRRIPPMVAAIFAGIITLLLTQSLQVGGIISDFVIPQVQAPTFTVQGFISVAIPLALLILSNDAAVGIGALEQNGYRPPVNKLISLNGVFSMVTAFFGGQSANIAGMMSAICSDENAGPKEQRYLGAVVSGILILLFGLFSWKLVPLIQSLPQAFVSIILGIALLGVFGNSLHVSYSNPTMKISVTFAFIIAISNLTIFSISAPVWALAGGTFIARYVENNS